MLLIQLHADVFLEQGCQSDRRLARQLRRDARVEQADRPKAVIAIEDAEIVIRVMERLFELRIRQHGAHGAQVGLGDGHGIDQRRLRRTRDLQEVDAVAVAMKARCFGIDADARLPPHGGDERRQLGTGVDVQRSAHSCFPSASIPAAICSSALANVL